MLFLLCLIPGVFREEQEVGVGIWGRWKMVAHRQSWALGFWVNLCLCFSMREMRGLFGWFLNSFQVLKFWVNTSYTDKWLLREQQWPFLEAPSLPPPPWPSSSSVPGAPRSSWALRWKLHSHGATVPPSSTCPEPWAVGLCLSHQQGTIPPHPRGSCYLGVLGPITDAVPTCVHLQNRNKALSAEAIVRIKEVE